MAYLQLHQIKKSFEDAHIIKGVDLEIQKGEFIVFVGPSGCGKSTLLRMVAGLESVTAGEIRIGGQRANDIPPAKRGAALVFQSYALFPHMTVAENVAYGLRARGARGPDIAAKVNRFLETVQLGGFRDRLPRLN